MEAQLEKAKKSGVLHLSLQQLQLVPSDIFLLSKLCRLDLGYNDIKNIPDGIANLEHLEYLWVNNNPLEVISPDIYKCRKLKEVDLRQTSLRKLPCEMGRISNLQLVVVDQVPLKSKYLNGSKALLACLRRKDTRIQLKRKLFETLCEGPYREIANTPEGEQPIQKLVKSVFHEFENVDELKSLIRNAERLFPPNVHAAEAAKIRAVFAKVRSDNEKKKLEAELEIKIRRIYFDRIDPQLVEGMIKGIYEEITMLDDIKFLIKHAVALFPPKAKDVNPSDLHEALIALQQKLAEERAAAIQSLLNSVGSHYGDIEDAKVEALTSEVAALFKNAKDLKSLAADVGLHFPPEFLAAVPEQIKASFMKSKSEMLGKATT